MELPVSWIAVDYPSMLHVDDALLRQCKIGVAYDFDGPRAEPASAEWTPYEGDARYGFTALGAYVGLALRRWLGVPVGLINMTLGGSPIESWLDRSTVASHGEFAAMLERYSSTVEADRLSAASIAARDEWRHEEERRRRPAAGLQWSRVLLPGDVFAQLSQLRGSHGELLLRKRFVLPADGEDWESEEGLLRLGTMTDRDETTVNGIRVGAGEDRYCLRDYPIPAGVLHGGVDEIMVRLSVDGDDARVALGKQMSLAVGDADGRKTVVDLAGAWECSVLAPMDGPCPQEDFVRWKPTGLFNAMTAPIAGYTARAVLWYQGESNTGEPTSRMYGELLGEMIGLWRRKWAQPRLPFIIVQLPELTVDAADDGGWPAVRDAQWKASLALDDVATVVTLGCGDPYDLHPVDKRSVAGLVVEALRDLAYGDDCGRPIPFACEAGMAAAEDGGWNLTIRFAQVSFHHGMRTVEPFKGTLIAGDDAEGCEVVVELADGAKRSVDAVIDGNVLRVHGCADLGRPVVVECNWANNPRGNLLAASSGIVVPPFRLTVA